MSHGIDILYGKKVDTFTESLPMRQKAREDWIRQILSAGRPATKSFDMGTMAARILAGRFPEKFDGDKLPAAFVLNAERNDVGRFWFTRGLTLLSHALDIEINYENLVNPTDVEVETAFHSETGYIMGGIRMPKQPEHNFDIFPPDVNEVFSFQIYTLEDFANITAAAKA